MKESHERRPSQPPRPRVMRRVGQLAGRAEVAKRLAGRVCLIDDGGKAAVCLDGNRTRSMRWE
jgi:hypothetical protein